MPSGRWRARGRSSSTASCVQNIRTQCKCDPGYVGSPGYCKPDGPKCRKCPYNLVPTADCVTHQSSQCVCPHGYVQHGGKWCYPAEPGCNGKGKGKGYSSGDCSGKGKGKGGKGGDGSYYSSSVHYESLEGGAESSTTEAVPQSGSFMASVVSAMVMLLAAALSLLQR